MSRFDMPTKTIHAEWWEDDEEVVIRCLSYGEKVAIGKRIIGKHKVGGNSEALDINTSDEINKAVFAASIVSWTFANGNGEIVPVTIENIYRLSERDVDFIDGQIGEFNPKRDKNFPGAGGDGSADGQGEIPG